MKFTRWSRRTGGKVHLRRPGTWHYLCGKRVRDGDQGVLLKIGLCSTCVRVIKIIEKRGY